MSKPLVELVKIGRYKNAGQDPALRPPAQIFRCFGSASDDLIDLATDGTWFEPKSEVVRVKVGKKMVTSTRRRIAWVDGGALRLAKEVVVINNPPSFDRQRGIAYLACFDAKLMQLTLADGRLDPVEVTGVKYDDDDEPLFDSCHALEDGRVVLVIPSNPLGVEVCERGPSGLVSKIRTTMFHVLTVVRGRVLVGGGTQLFALAFSADRAHVLAHFPEVDNDMMRVVDGRPRFYGAKGAFEVQGLDDAWAAFRERPGDFPVYEGWPG